MSCLRLNPDSFTGCIVNLFVYSRRTLFPKHLLLRYPGCLRPIALIVAAAIAASGCAKNYSPDLCESLDPEYYTETHDPFENMNRGIYSFNEKVDAALIEPFARSYRDNTPDPVQLAVSNFFNNLKEPRNTVASILIADAPGAASSGFRFIVNSTFGIAGLIDIAGHGGLDYESTDFGQVAGYWGVGDGPYIVIPFVGPSNARDIMGSAVHNRTTYVVKRIEKDEHQLLVQNFAWVDARAKLLPFTDLLEDQPDPYIFVRESYRQSRLNAICN